MIHRPFTLLATGIFVLTCLLTAYFYLEGTNLTLGWQLATGAEKETLTVHSFQKGPFHFEITGEQYILTERFGADPIRIHPAITQGYLAFIWLAICGLLAATTYWKRWWFLGAGGSMLLFINFLDLDATGFLGQFAKTGTMLLMAFTLAPAYFFHAFRTQATFFHRWIGIFSLSFLLFVYFAFSVPQSTGYLLDHAHYSLAVIAVFYVFLISEEIIFALLWLVTRSRGSHHNDRHFVIFSLFYIGYLTLYYGKKSGLFPIEIAFPNPLLLLGISMILALWSFRFKQAGYDKISEKSLDIRYPLFFMGLVTMGFLGMAFSRGNDPVFESIHYIVLYAHLGFGFMFFAYIFINFFTAVMQGLPVYKIVYKERNFPYLSARLGGLAIVAAFFFVSDKQALIHMMGAKFNYEGDYYAAMGEQRLADEYYRHGSVHSWNNHYANYQLGFRALEKSDINEAIYRFSSATKKNPSPHAYVNASNALVAAQDHSRVISLLNKGLIDFPSNPEISNNLALSHIKSGSRNEALSVLTQADKTEKWNQAVNVNKWAVGSIETPLEAYDKGNIAVKANILAKSNPVNDLALADSSLLNRVNLHAIAYLVNASWKLQQAPTSPYRDLYIGSTLSADIQKDIRYATAINSYFNGNVTDALRQLNILYENAHQFEKSYFLNGLGLLALEQNAYRLALTYFEQALERRSDEAYFYRAVTLMEDQNWPEARKAWELLVKRDSSYQRQYGEIGNVLNGNDDGSSLYTYYRVKDFDIQELSKRISLFTDFPIDQFWDRCMVVFSTQKPEMLSALFPVLQARLSQESRDKFQQYMTSQSDPSVVTMEEVAKNHLVPWKMAVLFSNPTILPEDKYNLLVDARDHAGLDPSYWYMYCFSALQMGLSEYADEGLMQVKQLVSKKEFDIFEKKYLEQRKQVQEQFSSWSSGTPGTPQ